MIAASFVRANALSSETPRGRMDKDTRVAIHSWVEMNDELDDHVSLEIRRIIRR